MNKPILTSDKITLTLKESISEERQGEYITLHFDVPEAIEEINVRLIVKNEKGNTIDLGLEGPSGMKGWSGGARRSIFVREDRATPGYLIEEIDPGKWGVVLNAYKVKGVCNVEVKVDMQPEAPRWIKGDLHMHSNHSDSPYSLSEVIVNAKEAGLEYIALTDHNTFSQNEAFEPQEDLVIIPAVELTTNRGHSNFYGVKKPFNDFRCQSMADVKHVIAEGEANGALISVNHPHCDHCWWEWGLEEFEFDYVEVWNGPWRERNLRTLHWWQSQLGLGKRMIALGGSDKHGPDEWIKYGGPTTFIKASKHSPEGILGAIKEGRACIASSPEGPLIDLEINGHRMGETLLVSEESSYLDLHVTIESFNGGRMKVYSSDGLSFERTLNQGNHRLTFQVKPSNSFYRIELWGEDKQLQDFTPQAISNPIFLKTTGADSNG
ncbi:CehA/McbA family metallohydrolase [Alteribacter populi]|uniref:CehA/McbA family metallohydrolase n=1 Tax=Alteribacter populi TaxID=2011011 RepID=UPI000BBAB8B5|nr:CehA/McbA family metallohydrolase [Alteribacter populi]